MEALIVSAGVVALAEIGDKTQLLALLLATRFRKPVPIVLGIFVATLANHAFASAVGNWLVSVVGADAMRWILGLSFLAMAAWSLIPDSAPEESAGDTAIRRVPDDCRSRSSSSKWATRRRSRPWRWPRNFSRWCGSCSAPRIGMMLANVPVVYLGDALIRRVPLEVGARRGRAHVRALGVYVLVFGS